MAPKIKQSIMAPTYAASKLNFNVMPAIMNNFKIMMIESEVTNTLNEAPISDKIYSYNGTNYGRPKFELLSEEDTKGIPGQKGFQFTKDNNGNLHLNTIIKAFHPQQNVTPLDFRTVNIELHYEGNLGEVVLPLEIKQTLPIKKANVLKHIYAHVVIQEEEKEAVYEALVNLGKTSKLVVKADVWWQKAAQKKPVVVKPVTPVKPKPKPVKPKVADVCTTFDYRKLTAKGNFLFLNHKGKTPFGIGGFAGMMRAMKPFMTFRNPKDAAKALATIKFYKFNQRCSVGKNFSYFLSNNKPPTGKMNGEDTISFNPARIEVKKVNNRWKIVEGNHSMFDFNTNYNEAKRTYDIIKKHGFDTSCFVGRPNPGMAYLKRTRPVRLQMINTFNPRMFMSARTQVKPITTTKPTISKPQKIEINSEIYLSYERNDATIFQGFFDELESKEYKWQQQTKIDIQNPNSSHSYYYRLTNDPNKVFFLPQVYRIGVNHETGEPKMYLNLYEDESKNYRINMTFHMEPYFHPSAKKDLMNDLRELSKNNIKYVDNLVLGGYKNVSFKVEERFLSDKSLFSQKITEELKEIEPSGFTITADHSLESFEAFKKELLTNGIDIGKIYFDLEQETQEGIVVERSNPIKVELNFKKLMNIPITVENLGDINSDNEDSVAEKMLKSFLDTVIDSGLKAVNKGKGAAPMGFHLKNSTNIPVNVEGVELTLLSTDGDFYYDVDSDLGTSSVSWPLEIDPEKREWVFIKQSDIDELSNENMVWNSLICEPYGMRANIDPEKIMASVIDHATGDSKMWQLNISSPLYENWENWSEEEKDPYKKIIGVIVEIKKENGEILSAKINRNNPSQAIEMSSTVQQMLSNKVTNNRKYQYRLKNVTLHPSEAGEWIDGFSTSYLEVFPEL